MAFNFNPLLAFTVLYSTLGTGMVVLPTKDPKEAIVSLSVLSANGQANTSGFEDLNGNAIVVAGEGRLRTDFFGLTGHQLFGTTFSNKQFTSIDQRLRSIIETNALRPEKGSWNIYYNFDEYLYEPKKGVDRGVGIFGRLGMPGSFGHPVRPAGPRDPEVYTSFDSFSCPWQTPADLSAYVAKFAKTGHDTRSTVSRPDNPNFR